VLQPPLDGRPAVQVDPRVGSHHDVREVGDVGDRWSRPDEAAPMPRTIDSCCAFSIALAVGAAPPVGATRFSGSRSGGAISSFFD
jgi:hypothetical protein